jgi:hypothetical protein
MVAACKRLTATCAPADVSTEEKLAAASRGVGGLFEEVSQNYVPMLHADVHNAQSLVAWHLHTLLATQIGAWLCSGANNFLQASACPVNISCCINTTYWSMHD